jgi:prevent-host-death family protein
MLGSTMAITASRLRANVYKVLDEVLETGTPVEIERRGQRLRIVPAEPSRRLDRLRQRPRYLKVDPESIVHLDWSDQWRP